MACSLWPCRCSRLLYDLLLDAVYVKGVLDISLGRTATWKHIAPTRSTQAVGR